MLFALHLFEIPAQSVVHREFLRELKGVQRVKPALYAVKPLNVVVPDSLRRPNWPRTKLAKPSPRLAP